MRLAVEIGFSRDGGHDATEQEGAKLVSRGRREIQIPAWKIPCVFCNPAAITCIKVSQIGSLKHSAALSSQSPNAPHKGKRPKLRTVQVVDVFPST
jgi:hypothetical protein